MINIKLRTWDILVRNKSFAPKSHKYFVVYNITTEKNKIFDNNILEQGCDLSVFGVHIEIRRKRAFCQVRDLYRFLNNYDNRIGYWSWRNDMWY